MAGALVALFLFVTGALMARPPDNALVLMPDEDGTVGRVVYTQGDASVTLEAAATGLNLDAAVTQDNVRAFSDTEIAALFSDALAATPDGPRSYLLYFDTGRSGADSEAEATINAVLADIVRRDIPRVAVIGHSDRVGSAAVNVRLARQRAETVRDILTTGGVPVEIITVRSHGEGDPLVPTADGVAEPRNRRVEVMVR